MKFLTYIFNIMYVLLCGLVIVIIHDIAIFVIDQDIFHDTMCNPLLSRVSALYILLFVGMWGIIGLFLINKLPKSKK